MIIRHILPHPPTHTLSSVTIMPSDVVLAGRLPPRSLPRLLLASLAICCAASVLGICLFSIHICHVPAAKPPRRLVYDPAGATGVLQETRRNQQYDEITTVFDPPPPRRVDTDRNGTWRSVATAPDDRTKNDDGSRSTVVVTACGEHNQDGDCMSMLPAVAASASFGDYRSYGNRCGLKTRQNYPPDAELRRGCEGRKRKDGPSGNGSDGTAPTADYDGDDEGLQVDEVSAVEDGKCKQVMEIKGRYRYFLAAVIANRIFEEDRLGMGPYETKQWIEYMLYAGVEHIFWYDTAHNDGEAQRQSLAAYAAAGLLTYHRFHGELFDPAESIPRGYHFEQDESYRHFLRNYANLSRWVVEVDVDEYPFSPEDTQACFLQRFVWGYERQNWAMQAQQQAPVTQILMNCMFFLGNPQYVVASGEGVNKNSSRSEAPPLSEDGAAEAAEGDAWVVEKYRRRKRESEGNWRQKPIFRAEEVARVEDGNPHRMVMRESGWTAAAEERRLRMNHYWGQRATDFRPDTPELVASLVPDASAAEAIVAPLKAFTRLISAARSSSAPAIHSRNHR